MAFEVTEPRLDDEARRLLVSGDPADALRIEPLLASGVAEHADFVAAFEDYRKALAERRREGDSAGGVGRDSTLTR